MKFHIALPNGALKTSLGQLEELTDAAEELGLEGVQALDHLLVGPDLKDVYPEVLEPLVLLAHLGARTRRIRLATSVIVLLMRNPFVVAKQVATLDVLTVGRMILGLGAGYSQAEFNNVGMGEVWTTRGKRLDEAIALFRHLFSGAGGPFVGKFYSYPEGWFGPLPPQGAKLPILIGGGSPGAMKRAATLGDMWQPVSGKPDEYREQLAALLAQKGDRDLEVGVRTTLTGTPDQVAARVREWQDAGAQHICINLGRDQSLMVGRLREFATEVMPEFV